MIPFAGPSNLFIASTAALGIANGDVGASLIIGGLVALAATLAKGIHHMVTFFVSKRLSEQRRARLDADAVKIRKWAFLLLFVAAASPIPDEPIVIPLGLMKYSPTKFFSAYFLGKISITIPGAILGIVTGDVFSAWLSIDAMVVISIVLTIVVTVILLKVDVGKLVKRIFKRKPAKEASSVSQEKIN